MKVGIIGCGNIGTKRAAVVAQSPHDQLVGLVEVDTAPWPRLRQAFNCPVFATPEPLWQEAEAVVISTPPQQHGTLIAAALKAGKDVLCEKPLAESLEEVAKVTSLAQKIGRVLKCGFNLRHDQGLARAKTLYDEGLIGTPYFLKADYVNGSVLVNTNRVGSLLDMGSHLLDLVFWFGGEPNAITGTRQRTEFPFPRDDNGFFTLTTTTFTAQLHCSLIRWQNHFQFEISGDKGAIEIINLPKWGTQELRLYRRVLPAGVPAVTTEVFAGDQSWAREWQHFRGLCGRRDLRENTHALQVMQCIETIEKTIPLRGL